MERYAPKLMSWPASMVSGEYQRSGPARHRGRIPYLDVPTSVARSSREAAGLTEFAASTRASSAYGAVPSSHGHYAMGGIRQRFGEVVRDEKNTVVPLVRRRRVRLRQRPRRQRLGTNSLVDLLVFGRRRAPDAATPARWSGRADRRCNRAVHAQLEAIRSRESKASPWRDPHELADVMMDTSASIATAVLTAALAKVRELEERNGAVSIGDCGRFQHGLLEANEMGYLLDLAEVTVVGALARRRAAERIRAKTSRANDAGGSSTACL